jgi:outer membrane protein assembly factor BamB
MRSTFASGLNRPGSLTFNIAGNLFVACGDGHIYKFQPNGVRTTFASGIYPYALAFDTGGNLFVTGWGNSSGYVYKYTWNGLRTTFAQLAAPLGLAFDSAGMLFVMDEDSGKIYKYTPNGVRTVFARMPGLVLDQTGYLAFEP